MKMSQIVHNQQYFLLVFVLSLLPFILHSTSSRVDANFHIGNEKRFGSRRRERNQHIHRWTNLYSLRMKSLYFPAAENIAIRIVGHQRLMADNEVNRHVRLITKVYRSFPSQFMARVIFFVLLCDLMEVPPKRFSFDLIGFFGEFGKGDGGGLLGVGLSFGVVVDDDWMNMLFWTGKFTQNRSSQSTPHIIGGEADGLYAMRLAWTEIHRALLKLLFALEAESSILLSFPVSLPSQMNFSRLSAPQNVKFWSAPSVVG